MRYLIIIVLIILLASSTPCEHTYCDGWNEGYKQGWCYRDPACVEPVVPVCPVPEAGEDEYRDGYNRGFLTGRKARSR